MHALFTGAFERCVELCDTIPRRNSATWKHVALLKARALLRLDRAHDALAVLADATAIPGGMDESVTARMLTGAAHVRCDRQQRGLQILTEALSDASSAHPTIRSEIALNIGLAHYGRRDFDAAERALDLVANDADLIHARALQYRAWIDAGRGENGRATRTFVRALETLDRCRHYDRFFEANCIRALAHLAVERFDRRTWAIVDARRARMDWSESGLTEPRFWIAYCAATYALDVEGNPIRAARAAREAELIAPSRAYRIQALCKRASVARCAGEPIGQRDHAEAAAELFAQLDPAELRGDEFIVPLVLAEALAHVGSTAEAQAALDIYCKLAPRSTMLGATNSPVTRAYQRLVEAEVLRSADERMSAARRFREALDIYRRVGFKRRAVMAALGLATTSGARELYAYAESETRHVSRESWLRREVERANVRPVRLTAVQREVLALICRGKSNPEIALSRKRSLHTIRNLVSRLFEIFEVSSREELAVECVRRGLYTPA